MNYYYTQGIGLDLFHRGEKETVGRKVFRHAGDSTRGKWK